MLPIAPGPRVIQQGWGDVVNAARQGPDDAPAHGENREIGKCIALFLEPVFNDRAPVVPLFLDGDKPGDIFFAVPEGFGQQLFLIFKNARFGRG